MKESFFLDTPIVPVWYNVVTTEPHHLAIGCKIFKNFDTQEITILSFVCFKSAEVINPHVVLLYHVAHRWRPFELYCISGCFDSVQQPVAGLRRNNPKTRVPKSSVSSSSQHMIFTPSDPTSTNRCVLLYLLLINLEHARWINNRRAGCLVVFVQCLYMDRLSRWAECSSCQIVVKNKA